MIPLSKWSDRFAATSKGSFGRGLQPRPNSCTPPGYSHVRTAITPRVQPRPYSCNPPGYSHVRTAITPPGYSHVRTAVPCYPPPSPPPPLPPFSLPHEFTLSRLVSPE
ncbi:hypothetical protein FKM82_023086 [Ascaphus truei]